jgi:type I restriction enzyme S subunit
LIFSIKPQIFELKCVFSYFRLKTHITLLLPVYVHSWEQRKVTEIGKIYIGLVTTMTKHYTDEGTLLIRNSDIKDGKFEFGDNPIYLEKTFAEKNETRMHQIGDVITVHTGDVGTSAVITENEAKSIGFATIVTRPNPKIIDSNYLCSFLNTDKHKKWAVSISTGDGRTNYNLGDYFELVVPVPSIAEQKKIASYIQKLNRLITLHQCKCQIDGCRFQSPLAITWEQRKVREVTDRYDNLRIPVAASLRVAGTTPYYGANGIQDYVDGYTHDGEFILVAEDGANDLKNYPVKCVKGRIWVNNHAHVLQGKYDCADNQFLAYAISQADIESLLVGGGRAKLNAETLMGIDLLLPNKAEQIRIGKYLAQLDNLITLHQRKPNFYTGGYYAE